MERRAARAEQMAALGELSAGRQVLEGAAIAPGNMRTLVALTDPTKRPREPRGPLVAVRGIVVGDVLNRMPMPPLFRLMALVRSIRNVERIEGDTGDRVLLFVRRFYGQLSLHIREDDVGDVQDIVQGEGGDQGDLLMPFLGGRCGPPGRRWQGLLGCAVARSFGCSLLDGSVASMHVFCFSHA